MFAHLSEKYVMPLRLAEHTGMRIGEVCNLEWGDVDFVSNRIRVRNGKTASARRWISVTPQFLDVLDRLEPLDYRPPGLRVFGAIGPAGAERAMKRACELAGIPAYSPHDLRHRYASLQTKAGMPRTELAALLGHSNTSLLPVYEHVIVD